MSQWCCSAQIVAVALSSGLAGCGTIALFGKYDIPQRPEVAAAPWPKLIDTPNAPPVGTYTPAVPNPAEGAATLSDLSVAGTAANVRAAQLAAPLAAEPGQAGAPAVQQAPEPRAQAAPAVPRPGQLGTAADDEIAAAAAARAAALARPVISDAERAAMLEAAGRTPPPAE